MTTQTMVFGSNLRRSEKWRVYQIRTANSTYELEVQSPSPGEERRCCVLTCVSPANRVGQSFEDSSPRAGDESLFKVSPLDWIGRTLTVGTACTSAVQSVEFVSVSDAPAPRRAGTNIGFAPSAPSAPVVESRPKAEAAPTWAPFPLGYVQMAEAAAAVLQNLEHRRDAQAALSNDPQLRRRLEHALTTCRLMLDALND